MSEHHSKFAANVMHFSRALRAAGLPVGPGSVLRALEALDRIDLRNREEFYWCLHACFVRRQDQKELFDQCFHIFWKDPQLLERMMQMMMPQIDMPDRQQEEQAIRRAVDAFAPEKLPGSGEDSKENEVEIEFDATLTWSQKEVLAEKDFEQMTASELVQAKKIIENMTLPLGEVRTRRFEISPHGNKFDMRKTFRRSLRSGSHSVEIVKSKQKSRPPPLVILCDISGSMARYSQLFLLFMHAVTSDRDSVHSFVFGTRLTNITRMLKHRDVDIALAEVGKKVQDWSGGTRIGHALKDFNQNWARRVLAQGALIVLISDGLDREEHSELPKEIERLHKSARKLVWLNPLLRYDAYQPISTGAKAIIREVDEFRPVHNLNSLEDMAFALDASRLSDRNMMSRWKKMAVEHER